MDTTLLHDRDYTFIIARTAVDDLGKPPGFAERWLVAQEAVLALAQICEEHDPDGITLYVACLSEETCNFKKHDQVTSAKLAPLIQGSYPPQRIGLKAVLELALNDYLRRKTAGTTKANGEIILVVLDGEPSDRMAVAKVIRDTTHQLDSDKELGIGFVQIGEDILARGFLSALDNHLKEVGAKFDIVDTQLLDAIELNSLTDFLLGTLYD
ncbi:MAG: hypothetical protein Kow00121_36970 [Elainellaceae cyanobacterium]